MMGRGSVLPLALITEHRSRVAYGVKTGSSNCGFQWLPSFLGQMVFLDCINTYVYMWHLHDRGFQRPHATHHGVWNGCWPGTASPRQPLYKLQRQAFQKGKKPWEAGVWENLKLSPDGLAVRPYLSEPGMKGERLDNLFLFISTFLSSLWRFAPRVALFYVYSSSFLLSLRESEAACSPAGRSGRNAEILQTTGGGQGPGISNALAVDASRSQCYQKLDSAESGRVVSPGWKSSAHFAEGRLPGAWLASFLGPGYVLIVLFKSQL